MSDDGSSHGTEPNLRKSLGNFGESYTCAQLCRRGYEIVSRNVRCRSGEIDIVASEGGELVFVEVKTRHRTPFATPEDAITEERLSHLEGDGDLD